MRIGSKVRLKEEFASRYEQAAPGAEGWVIDQTYDVVDFPYVRIQWDNDDWRACDEHNPLWTYRDHFDVVEEKSRDIVQEAKDFMHQHIEGDPGEDPSNSIELEQYVNRLMEAQENASEADGFMMIAIKKHEAPGEINFEPKVITHVRNPGIEGVLKMHILQMAANLHTEQIMQDYFMNDPDEDDQ